MGDTEFADIVLDVENSRSSGATQLIKNALRRAFGDVQVVPKYHGGILRKRVIWEAAVTTGGVHLCLRCKETDDL